MKLTFILILPAVIVCLPNIGFLTYYKFDRSLTRKKVLIDGILTLLVGLFSPWVATFVSAHGISMERQPDELVCATGAATFLFFGYLITLLATPTLTLILAMSTGKK